MSGNDRMQSTLTDSYFSAPSDVNDGNQEWTDEPMSMYDEPESESNLLEQGIETTHFLIEEAVNKALSDMPIRLIDTETGMLQDHGAIKDNIMNHPDITSITRGDVLSQDLQRAGISLYASESIDSIASFFSKQQKLSLGRSAYDLNVPYELFSNFLKIALAKGAATNMQVESLVWNRASVLAGHDLPRTGILRSLVLEVYKHIARVVEFTRGNLDGRVRNLLSYAMFSHRWLKHEEVLFSDLKLEASIYKVDLAGRRLRGLKKLREFCCTAWKHGFRWAWADTCCIDKGSSSEVQESITSMFNWYQNSALTIVYLHDLPDPSLAQRKAVSCLPRSLSRLTARALASAREDVLPDKDALDALLRHRLGHCEWFYGGWTLQELLAPKTLRFYSKNWRTLERADDSRRLFNQKDDPEWLASIKRVTGIEIGYLTSDGFSPGLANWDVKHKWAEERETERPEDKAYCLLGIFDVTMDIRYGEGEKAQKRLDELMRWEGPQTGHGRRTATVRASGAAEDLVRAVS
ncbi:hypothetical protein CONPUDRAFT_164562 [Coniophora puteana RWD-64-598 SS2]|uniref:Heterokaryon incompatibility domain-containing protein n=1 Tax=Coniophora puteana (strain RWD-64-598) TaxID=741705 RepID=A0A5M3MTD2_CONPW|nr:uncharacterized protein CONPUDRAFT_164562 [Coniophora puteana RWD-64-598 SS2]EIW81791.1 hypothetical protein CONPUDRAFT_164562 [Coniophora puteana RWD-64-598 SS2]